MIISFRCLVKDFWYQVNNSNGYDAYSTQINGIIEYAARNNFRYAAWGPKHDSHRVYFDNKVEYVYNGEKRIGKQDVTRITRPSS